MVVANFSLDSWGGNLVSIFVFLNLSVVLDTHFECLQVELEEGLVDGSKVLLDTGLAEAVCDAADEAPVFGESLGKC
jgi:hypothetical protein